MHPVTQGFYRAGIRRDTIPGVYLLAAAVNSLIRKDALVEIDRGIDGFNSETLRDPATNVDFGAWYLAKQIAAFGDGSLSTATISSAAAAYNGGPKHLKRHIEGGQPLSEETERYRQLIGALWSERHEKNSKTLASLSRRGN